MGFFEHGNEPLGFTKGGEFLNPLRNYQILGKGCAALS